MRSPRKGRCGQSPSDGDALRPQAETHSGGNARALSSNLRHAGASTQVPQNTAVAAAKMRLRSARGSWKIERAGDPYHNGVAVSVDRNAHARIFAFEEFGLF